MRGIIKRKEFELSPNPKKDFFDPFSILSSDEEKELEKQKESEEVRFANLDDVFTADDPEGD